MAQEFISRELRFSTKYCEEPNGVWLVRVSQSMTVTSLQFLMLFRYLVNQLHKQLQPIETPDRYERCKALSNKQNQKKYNEHAS
jgi:hypothetical protein